MPYVRIKDSVARAMVVKWAILSKKGKLKLLKDAITEYLVFPLSTNLQELSDLSDQKFDKLQEEHEGRWDPPNFVEQALGGPVREPEFRPPHTHTYTGEELRLASWTIDAKLMEKLSTQAEAEGMSADELAAKAMRVYDLRRQQLHE